MAEHGEELRQAGLYSLVDRAVWDKKFVVDIQPVDVTDKTVTYKIRRKGNRIETKTVAGVSFVEGFVQHVLPTGFMKIRHYGWMSGNSKITVDRSAIQGDRWRGRRGSKTQEAGDTVRYTTPGLPEQRT